MKLEMLGSDAGGMPWYEPAPRQFDLAVPTWVKFLLVGLAAVMAILFVDQRLAVWASGHPVPDLGKRNAMGRGDVGRELMWMEQFGQFVCTAIAVGAVYLLDAKGRRRALSLVVGCVVTVAVTHLLKEVIGRTRPFQFSADGSWMWGGLFRRPSAYSASFPSAHTTAAFALAAGLSWFYPRGRLLFMTLAVGTAVLRVLHTAHYLSDVLAGMGLGVALMRASLGYKLAGRLMLLAPERVRRWWLSDSHRSQ